MLIETFWIPVRSNVSRGECLQAAARGLKFREAASLWFDQVILDATYALSRLKDAIPIGRAFAEQDFVSLAARTEVFQP